MDYKAVQNERLTTAQKNKNSKQWYKDKADELYTWHLSKLGLTNISHSVYRETKINYDLFNDKLNTIDFKYVTNPFGADVGELPANMVNRDIVSSKIKALLGMEMKRPFTWKVIATNPEATTRKEQTEFQKVKDYVIYKSLTPIRQKIELQKQQELQGRELTPEEVKQVQIEIDDELKALTPDEIKRYMEREHQDPAEIMFHQLLEYLIEKTGAKRKFNEAFKHLHLSAKEILYVGVLNGEPEFWNVNSLRFNCDRSSTSPFIEDGESASCEYRMRASEVVKYFGDELKPSEIDKIYSDVNYYTQERLLDSMFEFRELEEDYNNTIRVLHTVWKSLRLIKFLSFYDEDGEEQMKFVGEDYELNEAAGDIEIHSEWIPEVYETWKIGTDIHVNMRPVPGQFKDLENIYEAKLPYYGAVLDDMNSEPTCIMDRLRNYQYFYNILWYKIELLVSTDKGKKLLMNMSMIPDSAGIDIEKWQYFFESSPFAWFDPSEEGSGYTDVNTIAKVLDMSLASDLNQYVEMAEYVKQQAGKSVGITEQVEGQVGANEAVSNTRQNLIQTSHILEPYFDIHNLVKRNVLQALIETAKVAYSQYGEDKVKLNYVVDGISNRLLTIDLGLLDNSTLGLFVSNSVDTSRIKEGIDQLAHAAMQTQKAEFSDIISVLKSKNIEEAEDILKVAEKDRKEYEERVEKRKLQAAAEHQDKIDKMKDKEMKHDINKIIVKEKEERETELMKAAIMGASFNPNQDVDGDGVNDFIEIAREGLDVDIKRRKIQLDEKELEHKKEVDKEKLKIENKKLKKTSK